MELWREPTAIISPGNHRIELHIRKLTSLFHTCRKRLLQRHLKQLARIEQRFFGDITLLMQFLLSRLTILRKQEEKWKHKQNVTKKLHKAEWFLD